MKPWPKAFALGVAIASLGALPARAGELDVALPIDLRLGDPSLGALAGPLAAGRSPHALPRAPKERWRKPIGAIGQLPAPTPDGGLVLALVAPELVRLEADGRERFRVRIGNAAAASRPTLTPDGHVAVVTAASHLAVVSPTGRLVALTPLPRSLVTRERASPQEGPLTLLALPDGALLVAGADAVAIVEPSGAVRLSIPLPDRLATELVPTPSGVLAFSQSGEIYRIDAARGAVRLASLHAPPVGPVQVLDARRVLVPVGFGRVLSFDPRTRVVVPHLVEPLGVAIDAPLAIAEGGATHALTSDGLLLAYDALGVELFREPVERGALVGFSQPLSPPPPQLGARHASGVTAHPVHPALAHAARVSAPAPLVDAAGRIALLRPSGRLALRGQGGALEVVSERVCAAPLALLPTGDGALAVVCREGVVASYADRGE